MRRQMEIRVPAAWPAQAPRVAEVETPLLFVDGDGRLVSWNAAAKAHLAVVADALDGLALHELAVDGNELAALFALTTNGRRERAEINLRSDVLVETISEVTIEPVMSGTRRIGALVAIRSLPRRFTAGTLVLRRHDALPDDDEPQVTAHSAHRVGLYDQLTRDIAAAAAAGERLGVIVVDVSGLRAVVERGEVPLPRELGGWVTASLRDGDSVTNLGGDEIVVRIGGDPGPVELALIVERLHRRIGAALRDRAAGRGPIRSAVALYPVDGTNPPQLLVCAYARLNDQPTLSP